MSLTGNKTSAGKRSQGERRKATGNALIYFCVVGMALSSIAKFLHPAPAVAYMASMGYESSTRRRPENATSGLDCYRYHSLRRASW
jgi:hypothetical protein